LKDTQSLSFDKEQLMAGSCKNFKFSASRKSPKEEKHFYGLREKREKI
jgi:hypothetical protein